jgi:8-amino-7-oxononanoate synthase
MANYIEEISQNKLYRIPVQKYLSERTFISAEKKFIDFCSTNYLSIDYRQELMDASSAYLKEWGTLTQWSRMEADCSIYANLEKEIGDLIGYQKVLLTHTISSGCTSHIPVIVGRNALMLCDKYLHPVVRTGCKLASLKNSTIMKFNVEDLSHLESLLIKNKDIKRKFIFVDGVHSLARYMAPVKELQFLCEKYQAWLYIDDAHGFGILGKNPSETNEWGFGGGGLIKHCNANDHRTFYTSSFGKAFCTHTAFTGIPEEFEEDIHSHAEQFLYSGPVSPAMVGMVHAALKINSEAGDEIRNDIYQKVKYFLKGLDDIHVQYQSVHHHPAIHVISGNVASVYVWNKVLIDHGIFSGIRVFPLTAKNENGFRFAITAANTYEQLDAALQALFLCTKQ